MRPSSSLVGSVRSGSRALLFVLGVLLLTVLLPQQAAPGGTAGSEDAPGTLRAALPARPGPHSHLTPLVYWGGFQTKSAVYEPLARFGPGGALEPALLAGWDVSDDGRAYTLRVRPGVTCHDGRALTADDVRDHLLRWRGNPGNRWLGSTDRIERVEATGPLELRVTLSEPWCLLEEAAIVNPGFVVPAGAYDHEGTLQRSVGTGPYRVTEADGEEGYTFEAHDGWWGGRPGLARIEVTRLTQEQAESGTALDRVLAGDLDLLADGEGPIVPRERLAALRADPRVKVWIGPGSGTTLLVLNTARGPFRALEARRRVAAAVDRGAWVRESELGYADPATTLFRAGRSGWPEASGVLPGARPASLPSLGAAAARPVPVTLLLGAGPSPRSERQVALLRAQLARAGFELLVERVAERAALAARQKEGAWDLALRTTHGEPYDPFVMLQILFLRRPEDRTAASSAPVWEDEGLVASVREGLAARTPEARARAFARVQQRLDEQLPLLPLFVHQRVAVSGAKVSGLTIGADAFDLGLGRVTAPTRSPTPLVARRAPPAAAPAASSAPAGAPAPAAAPSTVPAAPPEPRDGDVPLPAAKGWNAALLLDNSTGSAPVGIWTVRSFDVFPMLGCPDVVGLDDKGRIHVLTSYSGRWTPSTLLDDKKWLGGLEHMDLDPRLPGAELYTGGERGNLYQVVAHASGVLDARLIAETPGRAINILVGGDLDAAVPGPELYGFAWPGGLWRFLPAKQGPGFDALSLPTVSPRVRDGLLLPGRDGRPAEIVIASRDGLLQSLRVTDGQAVWTTLHQEPMGMGRVALKPRRSDAEPLVLYTTLDDGRILRHERAPGPGGAAEGRWSTETIYLGPQGPRGVAAGRFDADPSVETLAVFGYSAQVELLRRRAGGTFEREPLFTDRDKGHWLSAAELDGRNGTDELLCSGFGGRIVLLSRPPGFGKPGLVGAER